MTRTPDTLSGGQGKAAPRVAVVIPAYNAANCVSSAIESVLSQDFPSFETIVVDDGSTDNSADLLARYAGRVRVVRKSNAGLSSARNAGIRATQATYVAFLDADDWWLPGKLSRQVALMDTRPDLVFCSTAARVVGPGGKHMGEWHCGACARDTLEAIFLANAHVAGSGSSVLARRQALIEAGGFDERLRSLEDVDMWMRLAVKGGYLCIDEPLAVVAKGPQSMSRNLDAMRSAAMLVLRKNRHLLPANKRGAFWRHAYAGMLSDYAKWAYRSRRRMQAVRDVVAGLCIAPVSRGRLLLGLLAAMLRNERF